jgi:L-fuconolactonase
MKTAPMHYDGSTNSVRSLKEADRWLANQREAAIEPELPIIDPHHHIWLKPNNDYLGGDLERDVLSGHNIIATVFVECSTAYGEDGPAEMRPVGETKFVVKALPEQATGTRFAAGIVGRADLALGEMVRPVLEAQIEAAEGRFRGVRRPLRWDPEGIGLFGKPFQPSLAAGPSFRRGMAQLEPLGLSFDGWLFHHQLNEFADLAEAFPNTIMILNHVGGPLGIGRFSGKRRQVFQEWRQAMQDLSRRPNVLVKIGGLGMLYFGFDFHARALPPNSRELAEAWKPYVLECINLFGPTRCMFESNFPVDKQSCSYGAIWNAFKRLTQSFSENEKRHLYSQTAAEAYRLDI